MAFKFINILNGLKRAIDLLSSHVLYKAGHSETIEQILDDTLNKGVLDSIVVTDDGGLNISWSTGEIFDHANTLPVDTEAGSGTCSDNDINYLKWVSGTTLTLGTTKPGVDDIAITTIACQSGDIYDVSDNHPISHRTSGISEALRDIFPSVVIPPGLIVSEDPDPANALDVILSPGIYYLEGHERHEVPEIVTRTTNMIRWSSVAGAPASDTNAEVDPTQWNNAGAMEVVAANKYYRSSFFVVNGILHWVYPDKAYDTVAQAIAGNCPAKPTGLDNYPRSTCLILRGDATVLPEVGSEQWVDVRPLAGGVLTGGIISDHGLMGGLPDVEDHPGYITLDGARPFTGNQSAGDFKHTHQADGTNPGDSVVVQQGLDDANLLYTPDSVDAFSVAVHDYLNLGTIHMRSFFPDDGVEWGKFINRTTSTTDHMQYFQNAVDYAELSGGSITAIHCPNGLASVQSGLRIKKSISFIGPGASPTTGLTFDVQASWSGKTVILAQPLPEFTSGSTPFDGGEPITEGIQDCTIRGFRVHCNEYAPEGVMVTAFWNSRLKNIVVTDPTEKDFVIGTFQTIGYRSWEPNRIYAKYDPDNNTIAHRVSHNGDVYYCVTAHISETGVKEPGVAGADWTLEGTIENAPISVPILKVGVDGSSAFSMYEELVGFCVAPGSTAHCFVTYASMWYSKVSRCLFFSNQGDGIRILGGDNAEFDQVVCSNAIAQQGIDNYKDGEDKVLDDVVVFAGDIGVDNINRNIFNATYAHQNFYDLTKLIKLYKTTGNFTIDTTTYPDPVDEPNLELLGNEIQLRRGMYFGPYANNFRVTNSAILTAYFDDYPTALANGDLDDLYTSGMDLGHTRAHNHTHYFTDTDPQFGTRFLAQKNCRIMVDHGAKANEDIHLVRTVITNKRGISESADYLFEDDGDNAERPALQDIPGFVISDNDKGLEFYRIAEEDYEVFNGQAIGKLGDLIGRWSAGVDSDGNFSLMPSVGGEVFITSAILCTSITVTGPNFFTHSNNWFINNNEDTPNTNTSILHFMQDNGAGGNQDVAQLRKELGDDGLLFLINFHEGDIGIYNSAFGGLTIDGITGAATFSSNITVTGNLNGRNPDNFPTVTGGFTTNNLISVSDSVNKIHKDSGISSANVVQAFSNFGTTGLVLQSSGTTKNVSATTIPTSALVTALGSGTPQDITINASPLFNTNLYLNAAGTGQTTFHFQQGGSDVSQIIRQSGVNGLMYLYNSGTGGIKLFNKDFAHLFINDAGAIQTTGEYRAGGDIGGEANNISLTGSVDTPTTDPGWATSSSVDMNSPDGYIKMYVGTQAVTLPYWHT